MRIEEMLAAMEDWGASDLFLCTGKVPALRLSGQVAPLEMAATTVGEMDAFLAKLLAPHNRQRFEATGDLDVGYSQAGGKRFRLNLARQQGQISVVARALPTGDLLLDKLGLPACIAAFADLPRGLVLVTGATGSGKSTTLAALVHRINTTRRVHIVTIEDPIEFVHRDQQSRISQREIGADTESFQSALRHVVRESPDVILVGEMRDLDTMQVALQASLTGHLVFATLHTIDATQTLQRILSYYPEHLRGQAAMDLSMSLKGVVAQRLLPRADGKGRVVSAEVLTVSPAASRLIRDGRHEELQDLMKASTDAGMITFNRSLLQLYRAGAITVDQGKAYASNPDEFALSVQGMETGTAAFRHGDNGKGPTGEMDMKGLLRMVLDKGASDLHLTEGRPPIFRILGRLEPLPIAPLTAADMQLLLFSILTQRQRSIYELERELDFALALDSGQRFRINAYYQRGQMAAALRSIPTRVPEAKDLHLPDQVLELGLKPQGLLLVVGPTGSGKTTTMACLVDLINQNRACRIVTVEDPIEYVHTEKMATIDQREVYDDTKSFAAALKYILRQDPDVVLVGEMRDSETTHAAITAAETGHLVLATLHTNDAVQTIDRVVDVFPPHQQNQIRSQLAASLLAVVSQRLLPRKDGAGRVPALEIMVATPAIRHMIREGKMHQALTAMETGSGEGMMSLDKSLQRLMRENLVSREDAMRYVKNPQSLGVGDDAPEDVDKDIDVPADATVHATEPAAPAKKPPVPPWER